MTFMKLWWKFRPKKKRLFFYCDWNSWIFTAPHAESWEMFGVWRNIKTYRDSVDPDTLIDINIAIKSGGMKRIMQDYKESFYDGDYEHRYILRW